MKENRLRLSFILGIFGALHLMILFSCSFAEKRHIVCMLCKTVTYRALQPGTCD
jgi:hypothetical protein